jgi:hypothetical protein
MTFLRGRSIVRAFAGLMLVPVVAATVVAQAPVGRSAFMPLAADSTMHAPALRSLVSVAVNDTPLSEVIASIARQASLGITYDPALPGLERKTTVTLARVPAARAILRVLENAPIRAMVSASGQIVLVPTPPRRAGTIDGTVRDATTATPVAGARIELVGTGLAAVSRERGDFSLGRVPAGRYVARITRLGFHPVTVENLSVADDSDATPIDVSLEYAPIPLAAVVVTPGYFGMMHPTLGAQQTMSRERIETIPQIAEDVYRAVNRLPGVTSNDFSADFSVRGGSGSELYVTLDGLELIEPFHLKDVGGGLSIIDSRAIGSLDLTTGGFGAEFGDRLTGVFTMRSVDPRSDGARTSVGLSVMNARLTSQGTFDGKRGAWLVSARRGYLDLALRLAQTGDSIKPRYYDLFGKASYDLGRLGRIGVHALDAGDALKYLDAPDPSIRSRYRSSYAWATWEGDYGSLRQQTVASLGALRWHRRGDRVDQGMLTALVNDHRTLSVGGVRQDWSLDIGPRVLLKFGADLKQSDADYDYFNRVGTTLVENGARVWSWDTTIVRHTPRSTRVGLYAAPRLRPFRSLAVELGVRFDRTSHTGDEILSPRLNVAWTPLPGTSVRGAWGRYSQSQPLAALQAQDGVDEFFSAERAEHRVVGVEQLLPAGFNARIEAYDRRLFDPRPRFISAGPGVEVFPEIGWDRLRVDPSRGRARGLELLLARDEGQRVLWSTGYALASVTDRIAGRTVPRSIDQRHTITGDWAYRSKSNKWRFSTAGVWRSGWPYTPPILTVDTVANTPTLFDIVVTRSPGELNSERLPSYRRIDARWTRFIDTRNGRVALFLEVYNLLDAKNRRGYSTNINVDRNRQVSFPREGQDWLPRLPTFGITWEFGSAGR